jgi:serine/threonine protein kinase
MSFQPGQIIKSKKQRYRLVKRLGEGGMAVLWSAEDLNAKAEGKMCEVAIKFVSPELVQKSETVSRRFKREGEVLGSLDGHPNIVPLLDVGVDDDDEQSFIVMGLVNGPSLADLIDRYLHELGLPPGGTDTAPQRVLDAPVVPIRTALHLIAQVLSASKHFHEQGVFHRDLKPSNVLLVYDLAKNPNVRLIDHDLGKNPNVQLIDFGIAKLDEEAQSTGDARQLTRDGVLIGTPNYMAPEMYFGIMDGPENTKWGVGPYTDIYAISVMLYEMLTGYAPYVGTPSKILNALIAAHGVSPDPSLHVRNLHPLLVSLTMKGLAPNPWDRFQTASEMMEALQEVEQAYNAMRRQETMSGPPSDPVELGYRFTEVSGRPQSTTGSTTNPEKKSSRRPLFAFMVGTTVAAFFATVWVLNTPKEPTSSSHVESAPAATIESTPSHDQPTAPRSAKRISEPLSPEAKKLLVSGNMIANGPKKDCEHALAFYKQAAEQSPNSREPYREIAECERQLGNHAGARAAMAKYKSFE